jgi:hypothetical protein
MGRNPFNLGGGKKRIWLKEDVGAGPGFQSTVQKNIPRHELLLP